MEYVIYFFHPAATALVKSGDDFGYWTSKTISRQNRKYPDCRSDASDSGVKRYTSKKRAVLGARAALEKYNLPYCIEEDTLDHWVVASSLELPAAVPAAGEDDSSFITPEESSFILNVYSLTRKSKDSIDRLYLLLSNFSKWCRKPLFSMDGRDGQKYMDFLIKRSGEGSLEKETVRSMYFELRCFYDSAAAQGLCQHPFAHLECPFPGKNQINVADLITLNDVDQLLSACSSDPQMYLAVILAFRMALRVSDIVSIKKSDLVFNKARQQLLLRVKRYVEEEGDVCDRYLAIPEDVRPSVDRVVALSEESYPYLFRSTHKKPFSKRGMLNRLKSLQPDPENAVTFLDLRALSLFLMVFEKIPKNQIALFSGIKGHWLYAYDHIPDELILNEACLVHIRIVP